MKIRISEESKQKVLTYFLVYAAIMFMAALTTFTFFRKLEDVQEKYLILGELQNLAVELLGIERENLYKDSIEISKSGALPMALQQDFNLAILKLKGKKSPDIDRLSPQLDSLSSLLLDYTSGFSAKPTALFSQTNIKLDSIRNELGKSQKANLPISLKNLENSFLTNGSLDAIMEVQKICFENMDPENFSKPQTTLEQLLVSYIHTFDRLVDQYQASVKNKPDLTTVEQKLEAIELAFLKNCQKMEIHYLSLVSHYIGLIRIAIVVMVTLSILVMMFMSISFKYISSY